MNSEESQVIDTPSGEQQIVAEAPALDEQLAEQPSVVEQLAPVQAPEVAEAPSEAEASASQGSAVPHTERRQARESRAPRPAKSRPDPRREKRERPRGPKPAMFKRFVSIVWSGKREPADDMFWVEAEREGDWMVIREFEAIRTRKEILERLQELPSGLVAVDFNLSYPQEFLELLKGEGIEDWRGLAKKVREDLKKNTDDGIRLWIERMGRYRESNLDPAPPPPRFERRDDRRDGDRRDRFSNNRNDRFQGERKSEPLPPYEQPSLAERFRRTDLALRKAAGPNLSSPIQIGYNRLTNRYEFSDANGRGRAALMGLSMIEQLLEARPEVAVWPINRPKELTLVEVLPWTFTSGKKLEANELRKMMAVHEDNGWEIPQSAIDLAARNADAQRALLCLIGLIKTETRENRERRPIRDYVDAFYDDPQVKAEGWFYSIGYRVSDDRKAAPPTDHTEEPVKEKPPRNQERRSETKASNNTEHPSVSNEAPLLESIPVAVDATPALTEDITEPASIEA